MHTYFILFFSNFWYICRIEVVIRYKEGLQVEGGCGGVYSGLDGNPRYFRHQRIKCHLHNRAASRTCEIKPTNPRTLKP